MVIYKIWKPLQNKIGIITQSINNETQGIQKLNIYNLLNFIMKEKGKENISVLHFFRVTFRGDNQPEVT